MAGLTSTGFKRKTVEEILAEIEADERSLLGPNLNTEAETPIGQFNGIFASKLGEIWELAEAVNSNQFPDTATGFGLDGVSSITGTFRNAATKGTVTLKLTLGVAITVPAGSIAAVSGDPTNRWVTLTDVTSVGAGDFTVEAEAEVAGNVVANATTITVIVTPISGWTAVTNDADANPGNEIDTDAQLRLRRETELALAGSGTIPAIRADLLQVADVTSVTVFNNPTDFTDANGLPPHSVEALVLGGTDAAVASALFETVGGGIKTFGTITVIVVDDQGFSQSMSFSRPTGIEIFLEIDLLVDAAEYPANGDALVKTAVAAFGTATYDVGDDVVLSKLNFAICSVTGITDITEIRVGTSAFPTQTTNLIIATREQAELRTARIVVTS